YVASHDLQEPLRMINSYVQLLATRYKDKLDQDANDFINFAVDGSNRMRNLINSLLEYSRVNREKPFEWLETDVILDGVLNDLSSQVKETGAIIIRSKLPKIFGDKVLIGLLFQNLIANALKFRSEQKPEIIIKGEQKGEDYEFSVKDNGIGIPKEYAEKIFIIFQRLHSKEKYPGTGIGLAICKKIVERHGGHIRMESAPGEGTTFYFTIRGITEPSGIDTTIQF
ncbi:MAG: sensor histidine kinase, partial [Bacteroidia bacterium]